MSFKAKDLTYDDTQPAFLQRLRGQITGDDARHERPIPRGHRLKQDEEEDAPTYVLEDTNQSLTKAEYEALVSAKDAEPDSDPKTATETEIKDSGPQPPKDAIAEVGKTTKKRKAVKVIAADEEDVEGSKKSDAKVIKKPRKKGRPVKLSFNEE